MAAAFSPRIDARSAPSYHGLAHLTTGATEAVALQPGIVKPPQKHATVLVLDLADASALQDALDTLTEDLHERLHDWYAGDGLTVTIGYGLPLFDKLGVRDAAPAGLRLMPGWEGDDFDPAAAQGDVVVQICADERSTTYQVEKSLLTHLRGVLTVKERHVGFGLPESRGVLGFVDGTGNPKGHDRVPVVAIPEGEPHAGGSFLVLRKIREDLSRWDRLAVDEQERVVGRKKADSAKLDPPESTPRTSHRLKSSYRDADGEEVEILRRSFPYDEGGEAGLIFICFVADLLQFEQVKGQMVSDHTGGERVGKDAIEDFYTTVSGGYYFAPPAPEGDGSLGDVLF